MWNAGRKLGAEGIRFRLMLAIVLVAVIGSPGVAHAQRGDIGAITTGDPASDALIAEIERVTADFVEAKEQFRSDRLDADVLLDAIGPEPSGIVAWVAQETRWLPYEGALRGARGVLMDRSGSSLDRALLLADLLGRAGHEVRLASATLDAAVAATLAMEASQRPWEPDDRPVSATPEELDAYRSAVRAASDELASLIGLLEEPAVGERDAADIIAEHWWVQASVDGQWVDHDPLFIGDAEGRPPAAVTLSPAEVPDDARHTVTVRVVIERLEDAGLVEEVPLEHTIHMGTDETPETIELEFGAWVPPEDVDRANETRDVIEGARLSTSWRPRLAAGDTMVTGEWFSEAGRLEPPVGLAQADSLSGGLDALDSLGSGPDEPEVDDTSLTAAWIEYESAGPGIDTRTERREILDLLGARRDAPTDITADAVVGDAADVRRGLAFLGDTEILLQTAATHPDAVIEALVDDWIELRPAFIALVFLAAGVEDERIRPSIASPDVRSIDLLAMTSARDRWAVSPAAFVGRPQIWAEHLFYDPADGGAAGLAIDIVMNDSGVIPGSGTDPRLVRLQQGILDTLIEHELGTDDSGLNTWDRFDQRGVEGVEWTAVAPGSDPDTTLGDVLPPADLARMRMATAEGDAIVVAAAPRRRGGEPFADWWRVSGDGTTVGLGYRGWGSEVTEEGAATQPSLQTLSARKEAIRVENKLAEYKKAYETWIKRGGDPHAHLRDHPSLVNPFDDTQPIIAALADTLPYITAL